MKENNEKENNGKEAEQQKHSAEKLLSIALENLKTFSDKDLEFFLSRIQEEYCMYCYTEGGYGCCCRRDD